MDSSPKNHHLLTHMLFQTCMTLWNMLVTKQFQSPLTLIVFFCAYNGSQWEQNCLVTNIVQKVFFGTT